MRRATSFVVLAGLVALSLAGPLVGQAEGQPDEKAMKKKMNQWARELGVKCGYCHVQKGREFDYEADTPLKAVGHACDEKFVKRLKVEEAPGRVRAVTCGDCHAGSPRPLPARPAAGATPPGGAAPATEAPPPGTEAPPEGKGH